jgi:hypothetical protein
MPVCAAAAPRTQIDMTLYGLGLAHESNPPEDIQSFEAQKATRTKKNISSGIDVVGLLTATHPTDQ